MKIKNLIQLIGIREKPRHYAYKMHDYDLGNDTIVHYAQWLHPKETKKIITNEMVDAYREILNEGDFCIDIGAHTGDSTIPIALAVKNQGCVLAMEPNPYVYYVLEKNARANRCITNIKPMMAAAGSTEDFLEFEYSDSGFCNGGRHEGISVLSHGHAFKQEVFCVDIEKELQEDFADVLPKLKFIKVDAEGFDLYVLQSMLDVITTYRPIVKAEVYKKTDLNYRRRLLSLFENLNYSVYKLDEEPVKKGPRLSEDNLEEWKHYDILCFPDNPSRESG
jgi:FkbM family methyltransferase